MIHHEVILRAPDDLAEGGAPAILQRSDEDFVQAVLGELRDRSRRLSLRASLAREESVATGTDTSLRRRAAGSRSLLGRLREARRGGTKALTAKAPADDGRSALETLRHSAEGARVLKLFQPIQRQFHLAVMQANCDTPGQPRIDPARIAGAGLVIRRLGRDASGRQVKQGWMRSGDQLRGWVRVGDEFEAPRYDPASRRRLARPSTGQPALDAEVLSLIRAEEGSVLEEQVTPMFVAPPDVCGDAGATLLYGLISTTSSERAESGAPALDEAAFGAATSAFRQHLVRPLRGLAETFPRAGQALTPGLADIAQVADDGGVDAERARMQRLLALLRQLAVEFDAFGDGSEALLTVLDRIPLTLADSDGRPLAQTRPAGEFLAEASAILLGGESRSPAPRMPVGWPALDADLVDDLADALFAGLARRFEQLAGAPGRFDSDGARYVLRAFVRLKADDCCQARTVWSDYSPAFVIAPWYEGSGAPPVQVALPDPTDKDMLAKLKPNVAFKVPASIQDLLGGDPKDLMEGKAPAGSGLGLGWICGFNIPIITICAFIVLSIFLSLFNLIFQWLLFIKICIPFPTVERSEE